MLSENTDMPFTSKHWESETCCVKWNRYDQRSSRKGKVKMEHLTTLVAYYLANKPMDSDWVVLSSASFNNFFGSTVFSKQVLKEITGTVIERTEMTCGSGRFRGNRNFM